MSVGHPITVVIRKVEIIKQDSVRRCVGIRGPTGDADDSPLFGDKQSIQQTVHEYEVPKMIDDKVLFHSVYQLLLVAAAKVARVADQHIYGHFHRPYALGALHDGLEIAEIEADWRGDSYHTPTRLFGALQ